MSEVETIPLTNPYPNGVVEEQKHLLEPFVSTLKEIRNKITSGERVYIQITSGERKGSIAYIKKLDPDYQNIEARLSYRSRNFRGSYLYHVENYWLCVILGWDKRRNQIKWSTNDHCEYLRNYKGPTVWKKFDKKAVEKKLLKETVILDRENNELKVGDRVLYINARYGSAATLDRGTIEDIKISATKTTYSDKEYHTIHVKIKNNNGSESDIKTPHSSILKLERILNEMD